MGASRPSRGKWSMADIYYCDYAVPISMLQLVCKYLALISLFEEKLGEVLGVARGCSALSQGYSHSSVSVYLVTAQFITGNTFGEAKVGPRVQWC